MPRIRTSLESAAADIDDLMGTVVTTIATKDRRKIVNVAKHQDQMPDLVSSDESSDSEDEPKQKKMKKIILSGSDGGHGQARSPQR